MAMVCPQCSTVYEQQQRICSKCSVQLLFYARMTSTGGEAAAMDDAGAPWQQTPLGRIVVGLILSQGLALGLRQLLTAGFQVHGDAAPTSLWATLTGVALLHSLHAMGLLVGGALAGAGAQRGVLYGALAGLASGMLFLIMQPQTIQLLSPELHFAQPGLHVLFGALGGWVGRTIWRPTPIVTAPATASTSPPPQLFEMRWLHGPIAWIRVALGAALAASGVAWSNGIMNW
ncbi:MAG: hypothetical protein NZO58_07755, partial [Gemmataceae bacterium]|nr:hypothetical protein [Gemmataceae bacterium]